MTQCHDLHPRVARTNGSRLPAICPTLWQAWGQAVHCRTGPGPCRPWRETNPARSMSALAAVAMSVPPRAISLRGVRMLPTESRSGSRADGTGTSTASTASG